nr:hypothetical protein [Phytohabitans suffuscus]
MAPDEDEPSLAWPTGDGTCAPLVSGAAVLGTGLRLRLGSAVGEGGAARLVNMKVPTSSWPSEAKVFHATLMRPSGSASTFWVIVRSSTAASPALCEALSWPVTTTAVPDCRTRSVKVSVTSVTGWLAVLMAAGTVLFSCVCADAGAAGTTTASAAVSAAVAAHNSR